MKKVAVVVLFVFLLVTSLTVFADCPTTAICPDHGVPGNPTGQYKWQGAVEYAQFSHPMPNGGTHTWWERCN